MSEPLRRLAFCITELDPGGAERALVQIVTRLDRRRWQPMVYCLAGEGAMMEPLQRADVPVTCLGARRRWDLGIVGQLRRALESFRPDVLQTFLFHANIVGRLAASRTEVPVVVSGVRVIEQDARWRMQLDRWTNRLVTHNVCVSQGIAERYVQLGFAEDKLSVIPNGVEAEAFNTVEPADLTAFGVPDAARVILAVGRLHPQKGFDQLITAGATLLGTHPDVHFIIVGEGPQRAALEQQAERTGHGDRIHLVGRRDDVPAIMKAAELFVLSSRWEGMPNVVLEAMAAGLPVVAMDVEGVAELVVDGATGRIVTSGSIEGLRRAMEDTLANPERGEMGSAGHQRVVEHFNWSDVVQAYDDLWSRLITG